MESFPQLVFRVSLPRRVPARKVLTEYRFKVRARKDRSFKVGLLARQRANWAMLPILNTYRVSMVFFLPALRVTLQILALPKVTIQMQPAGAIAHRAESY